MIPQLSPSEQLTYSTVRIECEMKSGGNSTGTGFFYAFAKGGDAFIPAIVTNKHVVKGSRNGLILLNTIGDTGLISPMSSAYKIGNFEQSWIFHPDDEVDLCVMPIAELMQHVQSQNLHPFFIPLDSSLIPNIEEIKEMTAIEEVIMIGYPNGIWDSVNNMPIVRRGVTSTHLNFDYNGKKEFMIDAACFPGSSGSPVFLFNFGNYATKSGDLVVGTRIKLLGVLYAGPQHMATGEIKIVNVPTQQSPVAFSRIPNNLGLIIKAERLLDFEVLLKRLAESSSQT